MPRKPGGKTCAETRANGEIFSCEEANRDELAKMALLIQSMPEKIGGRQGIRTPGLIVANGCFALLCA
jgi:hypothetical protein